MSQGVAFVVMPFGPKPGPDGRDINFDRVYLDYLKPAAEDGRESRALGCKLQAWPETRLLGSCDARMDGNAADGSGGTENMAAHVDKLTGRKPAIIDPATL